MTQLTVVLQTHDFLTQRDLPNVQFKVESLRWAARGGPESATITATGALASLEELIDYCSDPLLVYNERGDKVWYGYVEEVTVQNRGIEYGATLEGMANAVAVAYDDGKNGRQTTAWAQNGESINRYGRFEKLFTTTSRTPAQCEQLRDTKLDLLAHSLPIVRDDPGGDGQKVTLTCRGWYSSLNRRYYATSGLKQEYWIDLRTAFGVIIDDFYQWQWGDMWARIRFTAPMPWYVDTVSFSFNMEGSCPPLTVSVYAADGVMQSGNINPGTLLGTGTLTGMQPWNQLVAVTIRTAGGARLQFQPSTNYWFKFSTIRTTQHWSVACGPPQGTDNVWRVNGADNFNEVMNWTVLYRIAGVLDTAQQVEDAVLAKGDCITGVDQLDSAGIQTDAAREGDQRLGDIVEDLLNSGSANNVRMLCTVTEDRCLQIFEEPSPNVDAVAYLKRADGQIEDRLGNMVSPATNVAGQWVLRQEAVPPLSSAPPTESALIFVESCEYSASEDSLSIEPRTLPDLFSFFDLEEG